MAAYASPPRFWPLPLKSHETHWESNIMAGVQFLADLYQGSWNAELFQVPAPPVDEARISDILRKYGELLDQFPPSEVETLGRIPEELMVLMAQNGFFGLSIPAAYGGAGMNTLEYLRVVEGIAKLDLSVALVSLAHLSIGVKGLVLFGNDEQRAKYLPRAASGGTIFAYALTEPQIGSDAKHITTRAELSDDGRAYVLNGQKTYITNANYAGAMTVFAQLDPAKPGFMGAFIVETGWDGITIGKDMPKMGLKASSTAAVQFRDVRIPVENLLGKPGDGFKIAMTILNYGRLGLGAASVGLMEQSLHDMLKRAANRVQFGTAIMHFPLIQEKIVKARVYSAVSAAMNLFAAKLLDRYPLADLAVETSHCKLFGTTRAWDILNDALQVAGGSGYLATQPYEKRLRDFRVATVFEGTTEIHSIYPPLFVMRRITRQLGDRSLGILARLGHIISGLYKGVDCPVRFEHRMLRKAARFARRNASAIKRRLYAGLIVYGKKISRKEFLLRRLTTLSLYAYGTLALLGRFDQQHQGDPDPIGLLVLKAFVEEGRRARKDSRHLFETKLDALTRQLFHHMNTD
jgi:acyl-CoA dehydrogenase family member 9